MKQPVTVWLYYDGVWHNVTAADEVMHEGVTIVVTHGKADESADTTPDSATLRLKSLGGKYNPANAASELFGSIGANIPLRVRLNDTDYRVHVAATSWKPGRPVKITGTPWTDVEGYGTLNRLTQGNPPVETAPTRWIMANDPVAYWPFDDGSNAIAGKALVGDVDMTTFYTATDATVSFGTGVLAPWMPASLQTHGQIAISASLVLSAAPTVFTVDFMYRGYGVIDPTTLAYAILDIRATQFPYAFRNQLVFYWPAGGIPELKLWDSGASNLDTGSDAAAAKAWDDAPHHWRIKIEADGDIFVYLDGVEVMSANDAGFGSFVNTIDVEPYASNVDKGVYGPMVVWTGTPPTLADAVSAAFGWRDEYAGTRFLRLCAEDDITAVINGDETDTQVMGPQCPDTFIGQLKEIEITDAGIIHDTRDALGLTLRTGRSLLNQAHALVLSMTGATQIVPPLVPVTDDQNARNDITVTRRNGATARAVQETGPRNVQRPENDPQGIGRAPAQITVNTSTDDVLDDHANWHKFQGTVDEQRWPVVVVELSTDAQLAEDASAVEVGDRILIQSPVRDYTPDPIDLVTFGQVDTIGNNTRTLTFQCVPAKLFTVGEYASSVAGANDPDEPVRYNPRDSKTDAVFRAGFDTALVVEDQTGGACLWTRDTSAVPFDIRVKGVRLRVTAVSAPTGAVQTLTVVKEPVNDVLRTIPVNTPVELWAQARYAL